MLENFIYSVNTVMPIFVMVVIGYILKRVHFLDASFFAQSEKFVFKVALPCMLFLEVVNAGGADSFNVRLVLFACIGITASVVLTGLIICLFIHDNDKRGAMVQGIYRSNFAVLGVPLATNMFGESGAQAIAMLMPFVIVLFNTYAVIVLSVFAPREAKLSPRTMMAKTLKSIVTNPLIIAVVLGLPFIFFDWTLPTLLAKSVTYLSNTTFALALMSLGSTFTFAALRGKLRYSLAAAVCKTILLPALMLAIAYACGLRGMELGLLFVLFGSPSAVSSYIMAKNMKSDHELAGQILLLTTLLCLFTIFGGVFLLKSLSLI